MTIATPIATSIATPIARSITGNAGASFALSDLYASGENGILVPSINDARADGKLWQDAAKTTLATSVDDPVGYIEDYSGNGNDVSQSTSTARPLLKQDGSGNWYLYFDGIDDYLQSAAISPAEAQPITMFIAFQYTTINDVGFIDGITNPCFLRSTNVDGAGTAARVYAGTPNLDTGSVFSQDVTYVLGTLINGGSSAIYLNGSVEATGTAGTNSLDGITIGARKDGGIGLDGRIYSVLVVCSDKSDSLSDITSYMESVS